MKRGIALLLAAALALLLCGCEKESAATLQIGKTAFSEGVYAYVLHQVLRNADENATREELQQKAAEECGFGDYSVFYKAYVKRFGEKPSGCT